jgi:hypothetical protein
MRKAAKVTSAAFWLPVYLRSLASCRMEEIKASPKGNVGKGRTARKISLKSIVTRMAFPILVQLRT